MKRMHRVLKSALCKLGIHDQVPTLATAARRSEEMIQQARSFLANELPSADLPLDVVVLGSVARREVTPESDLDFLVIAHELPRRVTQTRKVLASVDRLRSKFALREHGRTGIFGNIVSAADLTERIGLQQDTNLTHSQRILLLHEGVSVFQPGRHQQLVGAILDRYLADYGVQKPPVPRFLLNDVLRYWRTLAVDYQAKRWEGLDAGWGLRYLKLIISRKLAFAGTVASLFLPERCTRGYLARQLAMPPLARVAQLHDVLEARLLPRLRAAILIAEDFATNLSDPAFREAAERVAGRAEFERVGELSEMRDRARELQSALENIFFDSKRLRDRSRKYLSF